MMQLFRWLIVCATAAVAAGCGPAQQPAKSGPAAQLETSFEEQLAAVRSGEVDRIEIRFRALSMDELAELQQLTDLKQLRLEQTPITDEGVELLLNLRELKILNLPRARFTDRALARFRQFSKLELLRCGSPQVSDDGIAHIRQLSRLRFLHLIDTPITDAGLKHLYGMTQLESFYIDGGNVTEAGLGELLKALPALHMHVRGDHLANDPNADKHGM